MFDTTNHICQRAWKVALVTAVTLVVAYGRNAIQPSTDPVSLYLNVETDKGLVTGLTQGNFQLYLDGKPQTFRLEKPEEAASTRIMLAPGAIA